MTRKGAIAVYLEPWHLDIVDFIDLKKNSGEERRRAHDLFPALWITDLFMERVIADEDWTLFDPYEVKDLSNKFGDEFKLAYESYEKNNSLRKQTMKAKDLWKKVLTSYFESGSPFLCFKDAANRANPNKHVGMIHSSNLCTEIFQNTSPNEYNVRIYFNIGAMSVDFAETDDVLLADGSVKKANKVTSLDRLGVELFPDDVFENADECYKASKVYCVEKVKVDGETAVCNLASVNLSKINTKEDIERVAPIAVRMLDNVIDLNFYPSIKVKDTNLMSRAIGLGVMGEAEMLACKQIHFGSKEHFEFINQIMEQINFSTIDSSCNLAIEKGAYPNFLGSNWELGIFPHDNTNELNWSLTSVKTSISNWNELKTKVKNHGVRNGYMMAIAPTSSISILVGTTQAIEPVYKRKWFEENLSGLIPVVVPKLSPETYQYYTPAFEIDQLQVIKAAAIRQRWIDQGQSTNIFVNPETTTGKTLNDIYTLAWQLGNKSTYYLRSQSPEAKNDVEDRSMECSGCQ